MSDEVAQQPGHVVALLEDELTLDEVLDGAEVEVVRERVAVRQLLQLVALIRENHRQLEKTRTSTGEDTRHCGRRLYGRRRCRRHLYGQSLWTASLWMASLWTASLWVASLHGWRHCGRRCYGLCLCGQCLCGQLCELRL